VSSHLEIADRHLAAAEILHATAALRVFFRAQPTLASARAVLARLEGLPQERLRRRVWVGRSFTIEPVFALLRAAALLEGLDLELRAGDFNTYAQEILDPDSALYAFDPHVVILAIQTRDLVPEVENYTGAQATQSVADAVANLSNLLSVLRERSAASVVVFDFAQPQHLADGVLDHQAANGQRGLVESLNDGLRAHAATMAGIFVLGFDALVASVGRANFFDERKWLTARMPFAAGSLWPVAQECLRVLLPATGRIRKAVVVDLDNTLWGGVIGEDGIEGIRIGREYPGAAYLAVQRVLLDLSRRGIILAVASKNNPDDALAVFDRHPAMLVRREHFAAMEIGWNPKPESLRKIAQELNIGLDSLVFVDDNPAEREAVRRELPEVLVLELPPDPMGYAACLREVPALERVRVAAEDRDRGRQYAEQRQRAALKTSAATLEDYYRSLDMTVEFTPLTEFNLARLSQLTQKTNQFNLTTRRYDEASLAALAQGGGVRIYGCTVRDRFGDNGLVGVAIVRTGPACWEIDTFLLSCRVIGRTVETAMLSHIAAQAREAGAGLLQGWFHPTPKNQPAVDFYQRHGFRQVEARDGAGLWEHDLTRADIAWPDWIARSVESLPA